MKKILYSLLIAGTAVLTGGGTSFAQEVFKFTWPQPATHYLWTEGGQIFVDEVVAKAGDKVRFETFPSGQLGRDYVSLLRSGVADMAIINVSTYAGEYFPLTSVAELPGLYNSACEGTHKLWALAKSDGILGSDEYVRADIHALFVSVLAPYVIMTGKKEVLTLEDMRALKIRAGGAAHSKIVSALGGTPVTIGSAEVYDALSRGTVDGALYPFSGIPPYDMQNQLKYSIEGVSMGAGSVIYGMSKKRWDALSPELQAIFTEAAAKAQQHNCESLDSQDGEIRKNVAEKYGFKINQLSPEQVKLWEERIGTVNDEWVKQMDGNGLKGTEALETFSNAPGN